MIEICFSIPYIIEIYPLLNECFSFTFDEIGNELTHVFSTKVFNLTQREKEILESCKTADGYNDPIKFALTTKENIYIRVPDNFNHKKVVDSLKPNLSNDEPIQYALLFMATLLYKERLDEPMTEGEYISSQVETYNHLIRPEMLKLYLAVNKLTTGDNDIRISVGGNPPTSLDNTDTWLSNMINEYLRKYLGVNSLEEAQEELDITYGKKVGAKINYDLALYMWGTYHLLQHSSLKSSTNKSVTRKQARLIESYLRTIELIKEEDIDTDAENIRARLNSFLKKYDSINQLLQLKDFKSSPNNKDGVRLW